MQQLRDDVYMPHLGIAFKTPEQTIAFVKFHDFIHIHIRIYIYQSVMFIPYTAFLSCCLLKLNFNLYLHIMSYGVLLLPYNGNLVLIVKDKLASTALNQLCRLTVSRIAGIVRANPAAAKLD